MKINIYGLVLFFAHPEIKISKEKLHWIMGCAKKRTNPKILNHVNRNFRELFTKAVIKAVDKLPSPWRRKSRGRKGHNPKVVGACCVLKVGFNETYDGIESLIKDSETIKRYYSDVPGHSVIHRGMQKLTTRYIRKAINLVTKFLRRKGMDIAVDSSGFSTHNSSKWYDIRIKRANKRRDCIKLHISIDVQTGIIHWFTITGWSRNDSREFERLLKHLPELEKVFGDKAYSSRKNCQIVMNKNGKPYLLFKKNASNKAKGKPAWIISIREYKKNKDAWLEVYHLRSIIESVFASIKRRWGSFLNSKKKWMQKKELSLKVLAYNVKQVLLVQYAQKLGVPLWVPVS